MFFSIAHPKIALSIGTRHCGSLAKADSYLLEQQSEVTLMISRQAKIQQDTHFRIMRILQEKPDLNQREMADILGISVGGLNFCINALIYKGLVKMQNFSGSKNKFKYVYLIIPMGIAETMTVTTRFLSRKMAEYEALKLHNEALKFEVDTLGQVKTQIA